MAPPALIELRGLDRAPKIFVASAAEDHDDLREVLRQLSPLARSFGVVIHSRDDVRVGEANHATLASLAAQADVLLLIVTAAFLDDDLCSTVLLPMAEQKQREKQGSVLAAYCKPCMWDVTAIGSLCVLPSNGIPVRLWPNPEAAWTEVARAVRACVQGQAASQRTPATLGVPPSPEAFYGRSADRTALKERLAAAVRSSGELPKAHVLTTLRGTAGMGKTTLALHLANDPEVHEMFSGGVVWSPLGTSRLVSAELVRIGRLFGAGDMVSEARMSQLVARLQGLLRERKVLIVVDDVSHPEDAAAYRRILGPQSALLVTTRQPATARNLSAVADSVYELTGLDAADAFAMFSALAPSVAAAEPDASAALLLALGHVPLAIRVAGSLVASEIALGAEPAAVLKELARGERLLDAPAPPDALDLDDLADPTVASVLRRSLVHLSETDGIRFAYLGMLPSKPAMFSAADAAEMWQTDEPLRTLRVLLDRGLIESAGGGRFQIHTLLSALARSLLQ